MASPISFALRAWYAFRMLRLRTHLQPSDLPVVTSGDPMADRVLLIGNGLMHGWGIPSHRMAVVGQLAETVASRTGRSCDTELIGAEAMDVRAVLSWVGNRDLYPIDAVVLALGTPDALRRMHVATWQRELERVLDAMQPRLHHKAVITIVGIPSPRSFGVYAGFVGWLTGRARRRLNTASRDLAWSRGLSYIEVPEERIEPGASPVAVARIAAQRIAENIAPLLSKARPTPVAREAEPEWQPAWSGTPAVVEQALTGGDEHLRRIADMATKSFGVELAVVSLVDGDRVYHANSVDVFPVSSPLELSFCRYTVASGEPVVIPDTGKDPRFTDNPLTDVSFINFYAGYPLRASNGEVIGSFCLQGSQPRQESAVAMDLLRQLAGEAQEVLRSYEVQPASGGIPIVNSFAPQEYAPIAQAVPRVLGGPYAG